jgi:hypothetical protein
MDREFFQLVPVLVTAGRAFSFWLLAFGYEQNLVPSRWTAFRELGSFSGAENFFGALFVGVVT